MTITMTLGHRVRWALARVIGWALGFVVASFVISAVARPLSPLAAGLVYVALYGAILGLVVGVTGWLLIPLGSARGYRVIGATVMGMAGGLVATALVGEALGNAIDPLLNVIVGEGTIEDVSGAVLGACVGLAEWLVLRDALPRARWWVAATAIGVGLAYGTASALLEVFELPVLKAVPVLTFGATVGIFVGVAQAAVLAANGSARSRPEET